jgi:NADPH2:quinone reductase
VGLAAVQLARAAGLTVIGTGGSEQGRKVVLEQGANHVLDHTAPGYLDQLNQLTENKGVNLVLEMLANVNLGKDLNLLSKGGRVVVVGNRGTVEIDPRAAMVRDATIFSMSSANTSPHELESIHAALVAGLENGSLRPVVQKEIPLAEAALAHREVMESGRFGKMVLIP